VVRQRFLLLRRRLVQLFVWLGLSLRAIEAEVQGGSRSIRGGPDFVIGGQAWSGAQPVDQLTAAIQAAMQAQ